MSVSARQFDVMLDIQERFEEARAEGDDRAMEYAITRAVNLDFEQLAQSLRSLRRIKQAK